MTSAAAASTVPDEAPRKFVQGLKHLGGRRDRDDDADDAEPERVEISVVGSTHVGKTSVLWRISKREFSQTIATVGVDFKSVWMMVNHPAYDTRAQVSLVDTPGSDQWQSIVPQQLRSADVIMLIFDASVQATFVALDRYAEVCAAQNGTCLRILVANKIDQYRALAEDEQWMRTIDMRAEAARLGCTAGYFPVSAKDDPASIDNLFVYAVDSAIVNQKRLEAEVNADDKVGAQKVIRLVARSNKRSPADKQKKWYSCGS